MEVRSAAPGVAARVGYTASRLSKGSWCGAPARFVLIAADDYRTARRSAVRGTGHPEWAGGGARSGSAHQVGCACKAARAAIRPASRAASICLKFNTRSSTSDSMAATRGSSRRLAVEAAGRRVAAVVARYPCRSKAAGGARAAWR